MFHIVLVGEFKSALHLLICFEPFQWSIGVSRSVLEGFLTPGCSGVLGAAWKAVHIEPWASMGYQDKR